MTALNETEVKQAAEDEPSLLERISKERTRYILFFTSTSVILITLGIIQTLLFEATTFFSEVADGRGAP